MIHDEKTVARFMAKVAQPAHGRACWFWKGAINKSSGYGVFYADGRARSAHRVAWEIGNRTTFPVGMFATHSCDNKRCVNFDHIRPGTREFNEREAWERGKKSSELAGRSKLSAADVHNIRKKADTVPHGQIATEFGISVGHVRRIQQRTSWSKLKTENSQ